MSHDIFCCCLGCLELDFATIMKLDNFKTVSFCYIHVVFKSFVESVFDIMKLNQFNSEQHS